MIASVLVVSLLAWPCWSRNDTQAAHMRPPLFEQIVIEVCRHGDSSPNIATLDH